MQERYSEEVKSILEAAQQQAVMNYQQELSCAHILVALSSSEGFFRFLRGGAHPKKKKPPSHKGTKARGTTQIPYVKNENYCYIRDKTLNSRNE